MNCPLCIDSVLDVTFHAGIELDICPTCRGVWLDRGELNRIADGTQTQVQRSTWNADQERSTSGDRNEHGRSDRGGIHGDRSSKKRKKSLASRLGDAFEEIIDL